MPRGNELHTILIVDDEERLRKALVRSLGQENCQILTAASAEEALGLLKESRIDLIITDLVLPGMDGLALVRRIRSAAACRKIIVITAYGSASSRREAQALQVACYLSKPFDLSFLKSKMNELLQTGETAELPGGKSSCRDRSGALSFVGSASGKALGAVAGFSRKILRSFHPRNIMLGAGRVSGAAIRICVGLAKEKEVNCE